ncbi:MAG: phenylalanine--tRNA ligase subunit alpha [Ignavibacteria bacterium]|nr:phenylalanine--tRNA ligase subunit alpha [Ignavibacteria bacterium]MBK7253989.1 phenylalanine--tRNA ligase subunit alpha [Ignavibacteria bacterium]MBK7445368.1 phenylalanine--tRNA ligase subunit alpha [Ignavibacteria bacterium]MBK9403933.1 phenylalanine--tRNA ligase subunit alpha [Ignavibacteria bacterium]MBL0108882.1 phenylalanine--tRNA ligase subunit alpha [Ignavibacteria bacterium]
MLDKIESIKSEAKSEFALIKDDKSLEDYRLKFLSRNGILNSLFEEFKEVSKESKGKVGKTLNELKVYLHKIYDEKKDSLESLAGNSIDSADISLPGLKYNKGTKHLLNTAIDEILEIFGRIGFSIYESDEIEDEYHNFDALNTPDYHPSRDMQDTFYIDSKGKDKQYLLRTHTSPGQIRVMEKNTPPIRVIVPGKCYRNEAISSRSLAFFHQFEVLYVDKNVTFRELKGTLNYFAKEFFGEQLKTRLRPSFFPFTEPSAEFDVECFLCKGKGCRVCKYTGWLEIGGAGMVDPNVFKIIGYDPEVYSGYAFGMGLERTLMIKYGIPDIRLFYENDVRFLKQF